MIEINKTSWVSIFLICLTMNVVGQAPVNIDSLKNIWNNVTNSDSLRFKAINKFYKTNTYAQPDSVLTLIEYHLKLANEKNSELEKSNALNERAYAYYIKGDTEKSLLYLKESIAILEQINGPNGIASVYSNLGNIYGEEGNYQEALEYFYKTLKVFREQKVRNGEARILYNIGLVYLNIDSYEFALEHLEKSVSIYNELDLKKSSGSVLSKIGSVYYNQGKYVEAIQKNEEAIGILLQLNNKFEAADCYFTLAKAYGKLNNNEKARYFVDKSLVIDQEIKNKSKIIERGIFDASLFLGTDLSKATKKAEAILKLIKPSTKNELKVGTYELLYKCYKAQNKYDLSLSMHEKQLLYSDSLQLQINKTAIIRKAIQNEYEDILNQTQLASEESQKKLKGDHFKKMSIIAAIFSLIIILIGFYSRSIIKTNQKEKADLLAELGKLKNAESKLVTEAAQFNLDRMKIEEYIQRKINDTDWKVLNILLEDPVIPNKEIAKRAFMSVDGIGSALRRMYDYFNVKESKYKKISLLMKAIKLSNN